MREVRWPIRRERYFGRHDRHWDYRQGIAGIFDAKAGVFVDARHRFCEFNGPREGVECRMLRSGKKMYVARTVTESHRLAVRRYIEG